MKEEEKKNKKSGVLCKVIVTTLLVAGAGYLAYRKVPKVKGLIDSILPKKKKPTLEVKTKPFRKYETYNKK